MTFFISGLRLKYSPISYFLSERGSLIFFAVRLSAQSKEDCLLYSVLSVLSAKGTD